MSKYIHAKLTEDFDRENLDASGQNDILAIIEEHEAMEVVIDEKKFDIIKWLRELRDEVQTKHPWCQSDPPNIQGFKTGYASGVTNAKSMILDMIDAKIKEVK